MTATPSPANRPWRVRIDATVDVDIHDPAVLERLALQRINETDYYSDTESLEEIRQHERATVTEGPIEALLFLVDPDGLLHDVDGVEIDSADVGVYRIDAEDRPDFAGLFATADDVDGWRLTPRTAAVLDEALSLLADWAYDDTEALGDDPINSTGDAEVLGQLPRLTWSQDLQWRRQMARTFDDLADDLEAGHHPLPRCFGEEAALHLAITHASETTADETSETLEETVAGLPAHPDDFDWTMCSEMLFQDHDVLLLDDPSHDGIEDPHSDENRTYGIGDLRPIAWFRPFNNVPRRDPHRGFRR